MAYDIGYDDNGEIIGADDVETLLGDDGYEIGARRRAPVRRPNQATQLAMALRQANQGVLVKQMSPSKNRQQVLGFDSGSTVAAGAAYTATAQPQVVFRPERLVLSSTSATNFLVLDLRVGKNSQFVSAGAIPGELFAHTAVGVRLKCDTAQVSNIITLQVQNVSGGALRFNAGLIGQTLE